jgi:hypothetical protein
MDRTRTDSADADGRSPPEPRPGVALTQIEMTTDKRIDHRTSPLPVPPDTRSAQRDSGPSDSAKGETADLAGIRPLPPPGNPVRRMSEGSPNQCLGAGSPRGQGRHHLRRCADRGRSAERWALEMRPSGNAGPHGWRSGAFQAPGPAADLATSLGPPCVLLMPVWRHFVGSKSPIGSGREAVWGIYPVRIRHGIAMGSPRGRARPPKARPRAGNCSRRNHRIGNCARGESSCHAHAYPGPKNRSACADSLTN